MLSAVACPLLRLKAMTSHPFSQHFITGGAVQASAHRLVSVGTFGPGIRTVKCGRSKPIHITTDYRELVWVARRHSTSGARAR
jgi:hypothetical protein